MPPPAPPAPVVQALNQQVVQFTQSKDVIARFADLGFTIEGSTGAQLDDFTRSEIDKWRSLIAAAGIAPE